MCLHIQGMEAKEFRDLLKELSLSQRELARRLGRDATTVNRWFLGKLPVPAYAEAYLRAILQTA